MLTVPNDSGVHDEGQESGLVGGGVLLQQSRGVVVADGDIGWALGDG